MQSPQNVAAAFTALSHKRRVLIYRALRNAPAKGLSHGALQAVTRLSPMTLTHHLGPMRAAGLVRRKRRGAFVYYALRPSAILNVIDSFVAEEAAEPRAA